MLEALQDSYIEEAKWLQYKVYNGDNYVENVLNRVKRAIGKAVCRDKIVSTTIW
jgi:hypothetical protein